MSDPIYDPSLPPEGPDAAAGQERPGAGLFDWLQTAMACILCAVLVFTCFARLSRVDGDSMHPTLLDGELTLVRTMGYRPQAGDIVVLNKTTARLGSWDSPQAIVKRVIATGGQVVDIDYGTGTVYVDGVALDEPYLAEEMYQPYSPYMALTHWEVPEDHVFVLGDNRNASSDSRDDRLGPVHEDFVLGKLVLAFWPFDRFGGVD